MRSRLTIVSIIFVVIAISCLWIFRESSYQMRGLAAASVLLVFSVTISLMAYKTTDSAGRLILAIYVASFFLLVVWEFIALVSHERVPLVAFLSFLAAPYLIYKFLESRKGKKKTE